MPEDPILKVWGHQMSKRLTRAKTSVKVLQYFVLFLFSTHIYLQHVVYLS
jgi:hypothetical protein